MDEYVTGRAISSGIRIGELEPDEVCDLIFYWIADGKDEAEQMRARGKFEVPPRGYRGSLTGTVWDPDSMLADFTPESFNEGEVKK